MKIIILLAEVTASSKEAVTGARPPSGHVSVEFRASLNSLALTNRTQLPEH